VRVIGYLRVSTAGQEYGIAAQRASIAATAEQRGWDVEWIEDAGRSGKDINRPGITRALSILRASEAEALVVSKLDRLSRSLADFARLL
jgi:DNA invertase Pin-like site-specific DNA recombinase